MASQTEKTFGSRLSNAESLSTHLSTFIAYSPVRPEDSQVNYNILLADIKTINALVATNKTIYSQAVDNRIKLFRKNSDSLLKTLAPIAGQVKAKFGKNSKEAKDISALIVKIRGEQTSKLKKDADGEFVSQSERSYGSQTQHFADIIAILTQYGADYAPSNIKIKIATLSTQLTALNAANIAVTTAFGQLKPAQETRQLQYTDLKDRSDRIKESIKSQYGTTSSEYKLIKGLKI